MALCFSVGFAIAIGIIAKNHSQGSRNPASSDPNPMRNAAINETAEQSKRRAAPEEKSLRDAREQVQQRKLMEESENRMMAVLVAPDQKTIQLAFTQSGRDREWDGNESARKCAARSRACAPCPRRPRAKSACVADAQKRGAGEGSRAR